MGQDLAKNSKVCDETTMDSVNAGVISRGKFSDSERQCLTQVFRKLAALSPKDNYIDKATFEHYFPLGGILGGRLFASFDKNRNGVIDAQEFIDGMSMCICGSADDKYQVAFDMFNLDESEGVSAIELYTVLKSVLLTTARQLNGRNQMDHPGGFSDVTQDEAELDNIARSIVQGAFSQRVADLDKDNKLTVDVFKSWMESHPFVLDSIFGQACIKDKRVQYIRLDDEPRPQPTGKSLNAVKAQTWVKPEDLEQAAEESETTFNGSYASAEYLWSPVFPQTNAKPCSRTKLDACLLYDCLYVYGGRGACSSLKDLWRYDIGDNAWLPVPSAEENRPPSLQEHTMSAYKEKLVIFGGEFTSSNETPLWMFDVGSCTWSRPKSKQRGPVNRKSHSAVICGDCLYVFGGYVDIRGATDELWKYEFASSTWTRERSKSNQWPSPRYSHSAALFDKSMVVFGGLEEMQCRNDMWLWNIAAKKWTRIKGKGSPPPVFGHTAVKVGDGMLVFGGESTDGTLYNNLWRFDFESRSWTTVPTLGMIAPPARSHHSLIPIPDFLICTLRPTSSHSAPPCTPALDREPICIATTNDLVTRLRAKTVPENSVASLGSLDYTEEKTSYGQSSVSLGSLNSPALLLETQTGTRPSHLNSSSLDSLVAKLELNNSQNLSMVNHGVEFSPTTSLTQEQLTKQFNSYNKPVEIRELNSTDGLRDEDGIQSNRTLCGTGNATSLTQEQVTRQLDSCNKPAENTEWNWTDGLQKVDGTQTSSTRNSTAIDAVGYGEKSTTERPSCEAINSATRDKENISSIRDRLHVSLLPPSQGLLKPMSAEGLSPGRGRSLPRVLPPEVKNTGIVYLMVLGGMSKRVENYGKSIDMWRCQIDPVKSKVKVPRQIVVQSSQPTPQIPEAVSGEYSRLEMARDAYDSDDQEDTNEDCVLMDVSDSDNTSMDLPLINSTIRTGTPPTSANSMSRVSV